MFTVTVQRLSLIYLLKITELLCISISVKIFFPLMDIVFSLDFNIKEPYECLQLQPTFFSHCLQFTYF